MHRLAVALTVASVPLWLQLSTDGGVSPGTVETSAFQSSFPHRTVTPNSEMQLYSALGGLAYCIRKVWCPETRRRAWIRALELAQIVDDNRVSVGGHSGGCSLISHLQC